MDWEKIQEQWDDQQEGYLPDREERFAVMLDVVEAVAGRSPFVLDLAGGTGSITRRALARFPQARSVVLDVDPALLTIAAGSLSGDNRVRIVRADMADPGWVATLGESGFDAVLTATALHWFRPERLAEIYGEVAGLLRPGGLVANADHMPDDGLEPDLGPALDGIAAARGAAARDRSAALDWEAWWEYLASFPELASGVAERNARFAERAGSNHTESEVPSSWHVAALRSAGFAAAGLVWRGLGDAVVVGITPGAPRSRPPSR